MRHYVYLRALAALSILMASTIAVAGDKEKTLQCDFSNCSWQHAEDECNCEQWTSAADVTLDPKDETALIALPGGGVLVSTLQGRAENRNLISKELYGDIEVHLEFFFAKGSNGGLKLQGLYEIQLRDAQELTNIAADGCGGVYPRAELRPRYRLLDEGVPPLVNASKPAGQWQTLCVQFQAPRFAANGKKTANAKLLKVVLNEKVIHENVDLEWPTGHYWNLKKEVVKGPLFLQGDHSPIAYRNVRVKPLTVNNE